MKHHIPDEFVQDLIKKCKSPEDINGEGGLVQSLIKKVYESALNGELTAHLGYEKGAPAGRGSGNSRNGYSSKNVKGEFGELTLAIPRDRNGTFEPQLVEKRQTRLDVFNEQIISLYSKGMTTRDIRDHLRDMYHVDVSPALISNVTNEVMAEVVEWQNRPLEACYPIVFLDGMRVKVREDGRVLNKVAYQVLGLSVEGHKHLLGMWLQDVESAGFWMMILTEIRNRGVEDIFIACVDGLKGFPEAIEAIYPNTKVQQCIVHMVRSSCKYVTSTDRKEVCSDLKEIYTATTEEMGRAVLDRFSNKWDARYPVISKAWKERWLRLSVFFSYPPAIRKVLYTTNPIEAVNRVFRKAVKTRSVFPTDEAVRKVFYLAAVDISKKWKQAAPFWKEAAAIFAVKYAERFPNPFTQNY